MTTADIVRSRTHRALCTLALTPVAICLLLAAIAAVHGTSTRAVVGCLLAAAVALPGGLYGCGRLDRILGVRP